MKITEELFEKIFHTTVISLFTLGLYFEIPKFISTLGSSSNFSVTNVFIYQGISYLLIPTFAFLLVRIWSNKQFISKYSINIYYIIYVFVVISFILAYAVLDLGKRLSEIPTVRIGTADGWLAFIGSIMGGVITMIAVVFTINNEREIRDSNNKKAKEDTIINLMPILNFDFKTNGKNIIETDEKNFHLISVLSNESNSHAIIKRIEFLRYKYESLNSTESIRDSESENTENEYEDKPSILYFNDSIIPGKVDKEFLFSCFLSEEFYSFFKSNKDDILLFYFYLRICYTDILGLQEYTQDITRTIEISVNNKSLKKIYNYRLHNVKSYYPPDRVNKKD